LSHHFKTPNMDWRQYQIFIFLFVLFRLNAQVNPCLVGDILLTKNDYLGAIDNYLNCYTQDTTNKKILQNLAYCYFQSGDYAMAKPTYHLLENDSASRDDAISKLAIIYESQQNLPKAIKYYISLNKIYPNQAIYLRKLANLYLQGRAVGEALLTYQKANQLNPRDVLTIQAMTEMFYNMDELSMADSIVQQGIKIDSTNIGLQLLKAKISYRLRDYKVSSEILYRLSFETDLNNYYNKLLGYAFMQTDSLDKAIYYLQKSLVQENDPEYALYYLALAHEKKREYDKAIWFFEEAAKAGISTNMAQYHRGLARIYTHQKSFSKVVSQYQKSLNYYTDAEVYYYMANAAEQIQAKKGNAITYYQKYIDSGHNNSEWIKHAKSRIKALKEYQFMNKK